MLLQYSIPFLKPNALLTGGVSWRAFLRLFAKTATAYGVRVQQLVERSRYHGK